MVDLSGMWFQHLHRCHPRRDVDPTLDWTHYSPEITSSDDNDDDDDDDEDTLFRHRYDLYVIENTTTASDGLITFAITPFQTVALFIPLLRTHHHLNPRTSPFV